MIVIASKLVSATEPPFVTANEGAILTENLSFVDAGKGGFCP